MKTYNKKLQKSKSLLIAFMLLVSGLMYAQVTPNPIDPNVKFACNNITLRATTAIPTGASVNWSIYEGNQDESIISIVSPNEPETEVRFTGYSWQGVQAYTFVRRVTLGQDIIGTDTLKYNFLNPDMYGGTNEFCYSDSELQLTNINSDLDEYNYQFNWRFSNNAIRTARIGSQVYLLNVPEGTHTARLIISKDECIDTVNYNIIRKAPIQLDNEYFARFNTIVNNNTIISNENRFVIPRQYEDFEGSNAGLYLTNKSTGETMWVGQNNYQDDTLTLPTGWRCDPIEIRVEYNDYDNNYNCPLLAEGHFTAMFGEECLNFKDDLYIQYQQQYKSFCSANSVLLEAITNINDQGATYTWSSDLAGLKFKRINRKTSEAYIEESELEAESGTNFSITLTSNNGLSYSRTYTLFTSNIDPLIIDESSNLTTIATQSGDSVYWYVEPIYGIEYSTLSMVEGLWGDTLFIYNKSTPYAKNVPVVKYYDDYENCPSSELVNIYFAPKYNQLPVIDNNRDLTTSTQQSNLFTIIKLDLPIDYEYLEISDQTKIGAPASHNDDDLIINIDYRLFPSFYGEDQLQYKACDGLSCYAGRLSINVEAINNNPIDVYNAVSPNGDGKHDYLHIDRINEYPDNRVVIYNRWGEVLFEVEGYDNETKIWEGKSKNGNPVPDGTYFYTIYLTKDKKDTIEKGFLSVKSN